MSSVAINCYQNQHFSSKHVDFQSNSFFCIFQLENIHMQVKGPSFWRISIFTRYLHDGKQSSNYSWNKKTVPPLLNDSNVCLVFLLSLFVLALFVKPSLHSSIVWSIENIIVMACVKNFFVNKYDYYACEPERAHPKMSINVNISPNKQIFQ